VLSGLWFCGLGAWCLEGWFACVCFGLVGVSIVADGLLWLFLFVCIWWSFWVACF